MARKKKEIPLLEISLALFSTYTAVLLFLTPDVIAANSEGVFYYLHKVMDQPAWALLFMAGSTTKVVGLVFDLWWLRRLGLTLSVLLYGTITICFAFDFPNFGFGIFFILTIMAAFQVYLVNKTQL